MRTETNITLNRIGRKPTSLGPSNTRPEATELVSDDTKALETEILALEAKVRHLRRMMRKKEREATVGLLSSKQAAEYLGISIYTFRNLRQAGLVPDCVVLKVPNGKACFYRARVLDLWLEERKQTMRDVA